MAPVAPNPKEEDWKTTKSQTDNTELDEILDKWLLGYSKDRWTWKHIRNDIQAWHDRQLSEQDIKSRIDELENIVKKAEIKGASFTFEYKYFADRLTELRSKL